jgi:hypothetical protein
MNLVPASHPGRHHEQTLPAGIMAMAGSIAQEISEKWPFTVARLGLELFGLPGYPDRQSAVGRALTLGLSGIVDGAADARRLAGVFALQERMMAVRLAGRKLVAFDPKRDVKFSPEHFGFLPGRICVSVWSTNREWLGRAERLARPADRILEITRGNPAPDGSMRAKFAGSGRPGKLWMVSPSSTAHQLVNTTVTLSNI